MRMDCNMPVPIVVFQISHVTQTDENSTSIRHELPENIDQLHGCFYTGHVRGDEQSKVTVSLCDGMVSTRVCASRQT